MKKITLLLLFALSFIAVTKTHAQINVKDSLALVALYNSTNGINWINNTNWLTTAPVSEWYGITAKNNKVVIVNLGFDSLSGTIPPELGNLSNLQSLNLDYNQISGTIPPELGNLSNLDSFLDLAYNQLSGSIPVELGNLKKLKSLYLYANQLGGNIPVELSNLTNLDNLYLNDNQLTGSIPAELGNLAKLGFLYVNNNQLTGSIPAELGNLKNLELLNLAHNDLSGIVPSTLGNIQNLRILYLSFNRLSGNIPSKLGNLKKLQELDLSKNQLVGSIPAEFGNLSKLKKLFLYSNNLSDTIPISLANLIDTSHFFKSLLIEENQFTFNGIEHLAEIVSSIDKFNFAYYPQAKLILHINSDTLSVSAGGTLSNNGYLWYKNNNFYKGFKGDSTLKITETGKYSVRVSNAIATDLILYSDTVNIDVLPAPVELVNVQDSLALVALYNSTNGINWSNNTNWLTAAPVINWHGITVENKRVTTIDLSFNNLSGTIPAELGNLANLQSLNLNYNLLIGTIPSKSGNLINLQSLNLSGNYLSGAIPSELGNLTNLQSLNLTDNYLSESIPSELGNLTNLQSLYLSYTQLSGSIPAELGNLSKLATLDLSYNGLSGSIPSELENLTNLQSLDLSGNQLSGSIPSELGNLTNLQSLYFGFNQLSGNIPAELGNLTNLGSLYLNNNQLSGNIPVELGNLSKLYIVSFVNNDLSGTIPAELSNLTNLEYLYLSFNKLSGSIPAELGNLANLGGLELDDNQLSGSIPVELGNLTNLYSLNLSNNQLNGAIPSELGNLKLGMLDLSYNRLSGSIPSNFGKLKKLQDLYLNNNQLSGIVPSELGNLSELKKLHLNNNLLNDSIPLSLADLIYNSRYFRDLTIQENQFIFNGIEHLAETIFSVNKFKFTYAPQAIIPLHDNGSTLSVSAGGTLSNNTYKWYKNSTLYKLLKGDSTLTVMEPGEYFVKVTNDIATDLTLHSDTINFGVLPVSLLSFTAQKQNNTSLLQWQTADEINNSYFNIERSSNSRIFSTIGRVDALNSSNKNSYSFTDKTPFQGINYYRLKQVDKDGTFTYSKIISTDFTDYSSLFNVSPNPATNEMKITIPKINSISQLTVYDVTGKKVMNEQIAANINSKQINISSLSAGVYNIVLLQNGKQQSLKLIKK